jgi:hypothetical protein
MEAVRTGLQAQGDKTAGAVSLFRIAGGLHGELVDRLDGKGDAGDGTNAALVRRGRALPDVVVVSTVDLVVELVAAGSVKGAGGIQARNVSWSSCVKLRPFRGISETALLPITALFAEDRV